MGVVSGSHTGEVFFVFKAADVPGVPGCFTTFPLGTEEVSALSKAHAGAGQMLSTMHVGGVCCHFTGGEEGEATGWPRVTKRTFTPGTGQER
jgi:hypothetical protein